MKHALKQMQYRFAVVYETLSIESRPSNFKDYFFYPVLNFLIHKSRTAGKEVTKRKEYKIQPG